MSPANQMAGNPHFFQPMPLTSGGRQVRHHPYVRTLGKFSSPLSQTQYKNIANVNAGFNHSVVGDSNAFEIDGGILKQLDMHNNDREKLHQIAIKLNQRYINSMSLIKERIQSSLEERLKELKGFENFLNESKKITNLYESIKKYKVNDGHQMGVKMHQVYIKLCECIALQKSTGGSPSNFEQIKRLQSDYESFKIIFGTIYQQFQIIMNLSNRWQNQACISESKIKMYIQFYGPIIKNQKELLEQIEKIESL